MVLRQKPQGGCQGQYISHPWEAVSLATAAKLQHQRTMWCIPGQVGGTLGAWALWREVPDTELSISNPAEPPPGCRNEIRESFTLHRDLYSHLVIDSLGGGLCPHPPLGNCLLLWGWGILEAMLGKRCFLFTLSSPSQPVHNCEDAYMKCTYMAIHTASLGLHQSSVHPLPNNESTRF